ncbi:MAG: chemotaxis protein CheC [Candidatus Lokiarchaeota archaeon]|nr:chemotaxis protein CheC [Candidatus Lokiarchaeota archaeon]
MESRTRCCNIEEFIEKGPESFDQFQRALSDNRQICFKIYIRLNPTCKLRKVRTYIILRELSKIGKIFFSKPDFSILDAGEVGLEIELYFMSEKTQLDILKTLEEILEIENKVITQMNKDDFMNLYKKSLSTELFATAESNNDISEEKLSFRGKVSNSIEKTKESAVLDQAKEGIKLEEDQKDALKEIGNIGAGNAANALARMINKRVDINIPSVEIFQSIDLERALGKNNDKVFFSWCDMSGKNEGFIVLSSHISDVTKLASIMINGSDSLAKKINLDNINFVGDFSDLFQSAFSELVSILFNHYSMAVTNLLGADFINNAPQMVVSIGNQLELLFKESMKILESTILVIMTDLTVRELKVKVKMIFIPLAETLSRLLKTLAEFI